MKKDVVFFDTEVGLDDKRIHDFGATRNGVSFHSADLRGFCAFASGAEFVCGHNIVHQEMIPTRGPLVPVGTKAHTDAPA